MFFDFLGWLLLWGIILGVPVGIISLILFLRKKTGQENSESDVVEVPITNQNSGLQISGLVLGILAILFAWFNLLATIVSILGIIFSAVGLKRTNLRGLAIAGLITSICGLAMTTFWGFVVLPLLNS